MSSESLSVERLPPVATASRERYSASVPDWSREAKSFWSWSPSRSLLASLRLHQRVAHSRNPWHAVLRKIAVLRHRFWSIVTGADIPLGCRIGGGLQLPHPNGVVIHGDVVLGPNCLIFQQVTLGANEAGVPTIGGQVDFGAGAKVHRAGHDRRSRADRCQCRRRVRCAGLGDRRRRAGAGAAAPPRAGSLMPA